MDRSKTSAGVPERQPRRRRDLVFVCMVSAMVLALLGSVTLRTMVPGYGPSAGRAAELPADGDVSALSDLPKPGPAHGVGTKSVSQAGVSH